MATYVLIYRGGSMEMDDEQRKKVMQAWDEWFSQLGDKVVDKGNPFGPSKTVKSSGITDGAGSDPATGYSIITAGSLDEAADHAKSLPIVADNGAVEVYETFQVM